MITTPKLLPPPLTDKTQFWVKVEFTHAKDGQRHTFYSAVNRLTGDRLTAFDRNPPSINDSKGWVKSVLRDILDKATDVRVIWNLKLIKPHN